MKQVLSPATNSLVRLSDIGARLRAFRIGRGISSEVLAQKLSISRAALYRAEKGEIRKIETLTNIAEVLGVSLPSLLGVGIEYVDTAAAFFERMRQMELECEQIIGLFGPVSYLLTSDDYDAMLEMVLKESVPQESADYAESLASVDTLMDILRQRKAAFRKRKPLLASLIASADIERPATTWSLKRTYIPSTSAWARSRPSSSQERNEVSMSAFFPRSIVVMSTPSQAMRRSALTLLEITPMLPVMVVGWA